MHLIHALIGKIKSRTEYIVALNAAILIAFILILERVSPPRINPLLHGYLFFMFYVGIPLLGLLLACGYAQMRWIWLHVMIGELMVAALCAVGIFAWGNIQNEAYTGFILTWPFFFMPSLLIGWLLFLFLRRQIMSRYNPNPTRTQQHWRQAFRVLYLIAVAVFLFCSLYRPSEQTLLDKAEYICYTHFSHRIGKSSLQYIGKDEETLAGLIIYKFKLQPSPGSKQTSEIFTIRLSPQGAHRGCF